MYYAGDCSECAFWETVLRNLVIETRQPQYVDEGLLAERSIARLELVQETSILDLRSPHFRHLSTSASRHAEWQRLCVIPESAYGETHSAARELMTAAPGAAGLSWQSRQIQSHTAYVFYSPPLGSIAFKTAEIIPLQEREGWQLVDKALHGVGVQRIKPGVLLAELLDEIPPEEAEDETG
ncbi:MAG: hypothetical protein QOI59_4463 [Gammaproteobacteria bacterium]|nr:hypothetical protein [Gammaproteobacteria bacterium]